MSLSTILQDTFEWVAEKYYNVASGALEYATSLLDAVISKNNYYQSFLAIFNQLPQEMQWILCLLDIKGCVLIVLGAKLAVFALRVTPMPWFLPNPWARS